MEASTSENARTMTTQKFDFKNVETQFGVLAEIYHQKYPNKFHPKKHYERTLESWNVFLTVLCGSLLIWGVTIGIVVAGGRANPILFARELLVPVLIGGVGTSMFLGFWIFIEKPIRLQKKEFARVATGFADDFLNGNIRDFESPSHLKEFVWKTLDEVASQEKKVAPSDTTEAKLRRMVNIARDAGIFPEKFVSSGECYKEIYNRIKLEVKAEVVCDATA